jgi:hypothetical protein
MDDILEYIHYKQLINPSNLFNSIKEVEDFLEIDATREDLLCFLKFCEEEDLYEYCRLIKERYEQLK